MRAGVGVLLAAVVATLVVGTGTAQADATPPITLCSSVTSTRPTGCPFRARKMRKRTMLALLPTRTDTCSVWPLA